MRQRQRQTDSQTETDKQRQIEAGRQADRGRQTDEQTHRRTDRQRDFSLVHTDDLVHTICLLPRAVQDRYILSGSWCANHALQEWDYGEGTLVREVKFPHKNGAFLYCAQYGDLDTVLAGGSGTDSVEIIESSTNRVSSLNPVLTPYPPPRGDHRVLHQQGQFT